MRFSSWTIKLRAATAGLSNLVCFTAPVLLRGRAAPLYLQRVHLQRQPLRRFSRIRDDRRTAGPGWVPRDRRRGDSGYTRFRPRSVIPRGTGWRDWTRKGRGTRRGARVFLQLFRKVWWARAGCVSGRPYIISLLTMHQQVFLRAHKLRNKYVFAAKTGRVGWERTTQAKDL